MKCLTTNRRWPGSTTAASAPARRRSSPPSSPGRLFLRQPDQFYFDRPRPAVQTRNQGPTPTTSKRSPSSITPPPLPRSSSNSPLGDSPRTDSTMATPASCFIARTSRSPSTRTFTGREPHVIEVHFPFPVRSSAEVMSKFKEALNKGRSNGRKVRLAVINHITLMPCVVVPMKELVRICREGGISFHFMPESHMNSQYGETEIGMLDMKLISEEINRSLKPNVPGILLEESTASLEPANSYLQSN
ncbi:hypothetical protein QJS04_geneDACA016815 [Acorus gramineus]|uniref:Uncharacterized protein n=1 Tax=Acorus gramineus TaxID=55184 RepID=A0AAV9A0D7_ACOGR|nr:hypothetical protein QJS04_geneDACA016815 [Acorus gramineus]